MLATTATIPIRSKLPATGTTIFTVMSALAQQHGAVNLGQGFPDYPIDSRLIELVAQAMHQGHNQYPLMAGVMALREAIAAKVERLRGTAIPSTRLRSPPVPTPGDLHLHPGAGTSGGRGDCLEPAYDSYIPRCASPAPPWSRCR